MNIFCTKDIKSQCSKTINMLSNLLELIRNLRCYHSCAFLWTLEAIDKTLDSAIQGMQDQRKQHSLEDQFELKYIIHFNICVVFIILISRIRYLSEFE